MRFFHDTKIRFMEYRWYWIIASTALNLVAIGLIFFGPGFKYGVDFAGGTQLTLKFASEPNLGRIRSALEGLKLGEVTIQRFDEANLHQYLIHMQNPVGQEGDFTAHMLEALEKEFGGGAGKIEVNLQGSDALRDALAQVNPDKAAGSFDDLRVHYKPMADEILSLRKRAGIIKGPEDLRSLAAVSGGVKAYLTQSAHFGEFALLAAESVGPIVGKDLREKATYAVSFSLLGMLIYIWVRFKLQYGIGAIVANIHDTLQAAHHGHGRGHQRHAFADDHHLRPDLGGGDGAVHLRRGRDQHVRIRACHRHHRRHVLLDVHRLADRPWHVELSGEAQARQPSPLRRTWGKGQSKSDRYRSPRNSFCCSLFPGVPVSVPRVLFPFSL
jgi:preprotein translocase subunit SecF